MNIFDDSEEEDSTLFSNSEYNIYMQYIDLIFVDIMKRKKYMKFSKNSTFFDHLKILIHSSASNQHLEICRQKLAQIKLNSVTVFNEESIDSNILLNDIVICLETLGLEKSSNYEVALKLLLEYCAPGVCVYICYIGTRRGFLSEPDWILESESLIKVNGSEDSGKDLMEIHYFLKYRKRWLGINQSAANMWSNIPLNSSNYNLKCEADNLERITVRICSVERQSHSLATSSSDRAAEILRKYGVCILPGLFPKSIVRMWGAAAPQDLDEAMKKLKQRNIDLNRPGEGAFINNFYELSMREARRCDLRNGREMKRLARQVELNKKNIFMESSRRCDCDTTLTGDMHGSDLLGKGTSYDHKGGRSGGVLPCHPLKSVSQRGALSPDVARDMESEVDPWWDLRAHPDILRILQTVMNPPTVAMLPPHPDLTEKSLKFQSSGNWGRWNFDGGGPEAAPAPVVAGEVGAIMTLPGCANQTIHADTPHLYVHTQVHTLHAPPLIRSLTCCTCSTAAPGSLREYVHACARLLRRAGPQVRQCTARDDMVWWEDWNCVGTPSRLLDLRPQSTCIIHVVDWLVGRYFEYPLRSVGQTAFVIGSHELPVSAQLMTTEGGDVELATRLVRPHLRTGDVLLFDCRVLHFGLANRSPGGGRPGGVQRPMVYVNYHQPWFVDPKNWNNEERLFSEEESTTSHLLDAPS